MPSPPWAFPTFNFFIASSISPLSTLPGGSGCLILIFILTLITCSPSHTLIHCSFKVLFLYLLHLLIPSHKHTIILLHATDVILFSPQCSFNIFPEKFLFRYFAEISSTHPLSLHFPLPVSFPTSYSPYIFSPVSLSLSLSSFSRTFSCVQHYIVTYVLQIRRRFLFHPAVDFSGAGGCNSTYLEVYDVDAAGESTLFNTLCGDVSALPFALQGPSLCEKSPIVRRP